MFHTSINCKEYEAIIKLLRSDSSLKVFCIHEDRNKKGFITIFNVLKSNKILRELYITRKIIGENVGNAAIKAITGERINENVGNAVISAFKK